MVKVLLGEVGFGESEKGIPNRQNSEELLTLHLRH